MIVPAPESSGIEAHPMARKRPGVVLVYYAFRLAIALFVAGPFAILIGRAVGDHPRGDAVLFDPGGMLLIEALRRTREALPPLGAEVVVLFVLAAFAGLLPLAALIAALGERGRVTAAFLGERALRPVGALALLLGAAMGAQVVVGLLVMAVTGVFARRPGLDVRASDQAWLGGTAIALLLVLAIGVVHDVARVAAVRGDLGLRGALLCALDTVRRAPGRVATAWLWRSLLAVFALGVASVIGSRIGVERPGQLVSGALVHQAAVLAAVFLRASWLAYALRHVDAALARDTLEDVFATDPAPASVPEPAPAEPEGDEGIAPEPALAEPVEPPVLAIDETPAAKNGAAPLAEEPSGETEEKLQRREDADA
jgi:hypothetical protein